MRTLTALRSTWQALSETLRLRAAAIRLHDAQAAQESLIQAYTGSAHALVSLGNEIERATHRTAEARRAYDTLRQQLSGAPQ